MGTVPISKKVSPFLMRFDQWPIWKKFIGPRQNVSDLGKTFCDIQWIQNTMGKIETNLVYKIVWPGQMSSNLKRRHYSITKTLRFSLRNIALDYANNSHWIIFERHVTGFDFGHTWMMTEMNGNESYIFIPMVAKICSHCFHATTNDCKASLLCVCDEI